MAEELSTYDSCNSWDWDKSVILCESKTITCEECNINYYTQQAKELMKAGRHGTVL